MDKIIGMGNALVDALVHIESDSVLDAMNPVSYTHLDVYKRQAFSCCNIAVGTLRPL